MLCLFIKTLQIFRDFPEFIAKFAGLETLTGPVSLQWCNMSVAVSQIICNLTVCSVGYSSQQHRKHHITGPLWESSRFASPKANNVKSVSMPLCHHLIIYLIEIKQRKITLLSIKRRCCYKIVCPICLSDPTLDVWIKRCLHVILQIVFWIHISWVSIYGIICWDTAVYFTASFKR